METTPRPGLITPHRSDPASPRGGASLGGASALNSRAQGRSCGTKGGNWSSLPRWAVIRLRQEGDESGPLGRVGKGALLPTSTPARLAKLTLFPGLGDDFGRTLAHHLGDVQWAVGLVGNGDGPIHSFCLDLREIMSMRSQTTPAPTLPSTCDTAVPQEHLGPLGGCNDGELPSDFPQSVTNADSQPPS